MSAQPVERAVPSAAPEIDEREHDGGPGSDLTAAPEQVEVRRNAAVSVVLGAAASAIAIAYLWRAVGSGAVLDWVLCALLGVMAVGFLRGLLDARAPLLVVDKMGVRIRLGTQWRGLPWEAIDRVVVRPRRGVLHDGRLVVHLHHLQRAVEGLEGRARRHAQLNRRMYGAALAVPLGLTTRVNGEEGVEGDLGDRVAALSQGRTEVVTLLDEPAPRKAATTAVEEADERPTFSDDLPPVTERRPRWLRRAQGAAEDQSGDEQPGEEQEARPEPDLETPPPAAMIPAQPGVEQPVTLGSFRVRDAVNPVEERASKVRAIARLGDPVAPLVIGEFEPEPAYDPVIGPELSAARTRVGLSVDELAERTRIRPHVIESIEVDDFSPCGGDFYARGHIRTLARVLGKDPAPMLEHFEARYATAPINARRVFEAELATGMTGSMRSTVGGPNWALLVGAVLALVLVWSGVRLFAGEDQQMLQNPPPVLNGSAGLGNVYGQPPTPATPKPVATTLSAVNAGTHVEVRDGDGAVVFEGDLVIGEVKRVEVDPPITVSSDNGGALSVALGRRDMGFLGEPDQPATQVFQRPGR